MKNVLKTQLIFIFLIIFEANAQKTTIVIANDSNQISSDIYNWHNKDLSKKSYGMSVDKAYQKLLKNKTPKKKVIVAVIDSGVDKDHEDLKDKMWINQKEIPNNNIDDDNNGYIDDVYGWNFCVDSNNVNYDADSYEATRFYAKYKNQFENVNRTELTPETQSIYDIYTKAKADYFKNNENAKKQTERITELVNNYLQADSFFTSKLNNSSYIISDIEQFNSTDSNELSFKNILLPLMQRGIDKNAIVSMQKRSSIGTDIHHNENYNIRKSDQFYLNNKSYGNSDSKGPNSSHGTHVAGIIAANRTNNKGILGVCDNCEIMAIRAVPNGDERDYDIANAIYYAADNGANIINMSFGKTYSLYPEVVAKAVQYASEKNILFIHAAGNASLNLDTILHYPHDSIPNFNVTENWLTIGAASFNMNNELPGIFSNYGKNTVDLFAPGVKIYSTTPNNNYAPFNGTSMATPAAAGVAALVWSYYPELSALELKKILIESGTDLGQKSVNRPDRSRKANEQIPFSELSKYGKVVNAYDALKLAEKWKK